MRCWGREGQILLFGGEAFSRCWGGEEQILLFGGVWFPEKEKFYLLVLLPESLVSGFPGFADISVGSVLGSDAARPLGIGRPLWDGCWRRLGFTKLGFSQAQG